MTSLRVRINEGEQAQVNYLWDSQWRPPEGAADWAIFDPSETKNLGGLSARAVLHTNIILSLFTDKRLPDDHPLRYLLQGADQRGWWGDAADVRTDLNETEMGSWLFVFERSILTEEIRRWVEVVAIDALTPLVNQGVCVRIDAQAKAEFAINRCDLFIQLYGRDGQRVYDAKFEDIWKQTVTSPAQGGPWAIPPAIILQRGFDPVVFDPCVFDTGDECVAPPGSAPSLRFNDAANSGYVPLI